MQMFVDFHIVRCWLLVVCCRLVDESDKRFGFNNSTQMKRKELWITLALVNLCIVALLGMTLRTKYLFPISFIDYKNVLSAHSHFAFGGWVTLTLMVLYVDLLLTSEQKNRNSYQVILWGIQINSFGMLLTFPIQGYALLSIAFSTLFIFFTYAFAWFFVRDLRKANVSKPVFWLAVSAITSLVLSSGGPFTLAYIMATKTGDAIMFRDAVYSYLHFQYNGFFTLSVFALLFHKIRVEGAREKNLKAFAVTLCLSVIPSLFLSLLWHAFNIYIRTFALVGCGLIIVTLYFFIATIPPIKTLLKNLPALARTLIIFSLVSFGIKMLLQTGTSIPSLGQAVFAYRPIIIGFLHLVFLGLVTLYCLAEFLLSGELLIESKFTRRAVIFFASAIIINETVLLIDGIGLMLNYGHPIYGWLLWIASILLFSGSIFLLAARLKSTAAMNKLTPAVDRVF